MLAGLCIQQTRWRLQSYSAFRRSRNVILLEVGIELNGHNLAGAHEIHGSTAWPCSSISTSRSFSLVGRAQQDSHVKKVGVTLLGSKTNRLLRGPSPFGWCYASRLPSSLRIPLTDQGALLQLSAPGVAIIRSWYTDCPISISPLNSMSKRRAPFQLVSTPSVHCLAAVGANVLSEP